jgi:hypothetical protein
MKTIKNLDVKVTYRVGLGDVKVPDKVFKQLKEIADKGIELDGTGMDYLEANEWLIDNIKERDCCDLEYEISELS